jgi:hypothetical protein
MWCHFTKYPLHPPILQLMLLHLLHHQQVKSSLKDSLPEHLIKMLVILCWAVICHKAQTVGLITGENALSIGPNGPEGICPTKE